MNQSKLAFGQTAWRSRAHRVWFRLCAVCLSVYLAYVTYLTRSRMFCGGVETAAALACFAALCVGLYLLLTRACERLARVSPPPCAEGERRPLRVFLLALGVCAAVFGCSFAAYYPGGVSYDAYNQWQQAHCGEFNHWHPVPHTLLIWLVTRVYDSYPFAVCAQIAAVSVALAYLTATLHRHGVPAWLALAVHALVAVSQPVRNTLMCLGKDSAMTMGALLLTAQTVRMLATRGEWLRKPRNAVAFGLALAFTTMMRHNAPAFTLPLWLCAALCFPKPRKGALMAGGVALAALLLVQGALMGALDVVYPRNTAEESVGIPMTILGNVKQAEPDALTPEAAAFLATLADDEAWQTVYRPNDYNSIKFTYERERMTDAPAILRMAAQTAANAPRAAFEAVNNVTELVWGVTGRNKSYEDVNNAGYIEEARYGRATMNELGKAAVAALEAPLRWLPLAWLNDNIGAQLVLLLATALWALRRRGVDALALALPTLLYCMATMLLLCGSDARFFQCATAVCIPCAAMYAYLPADVPVKQEGSGAGKGGARQ